MAYDQAVTERVERMTHEILKVGVIGAGQMGNGIAQVCALAGLDVLMNDISQDRINAGLATVDGAMARDVAKGLLSEADRKAAMDRIKAAAAFEDLVDCDLVMEAASENEETKRKILTRLSPYLKPGAFIATNTSSLNIDAIAEATSRPELVVGTHFFAPAHKMKLLENVRGRHTSPQTIATVMALGKVLGKVTALAGNCDGFIGNRMLQYYSGQAEFLLEQGATPEQIDRVALAFGMPMGPLAVRDMTGIDVNVLVRQARRKTLSPQDRLSDIPDRLFAAGRLGQMSGAGYYR